MKKQLFYLSAIFAFVILFGSCGKYEDGPSFSLRTKTSRLTGEWKIEKLILNDVEQQLPVEAQNSSMIFESGGVGKITYTQSAISIALDLEWKFGSEKETIKVRIKSFTGSWGDWGESTILRLTNSEFWFKDISSTSSDITITHLAKV